MRFVLIALLIACGAEEAAPPAAPERVLLDPEPAPEPEPDPDADFRCSSDDECVPATDECNGLVGVRRERAEDYERRMAEARPRVECGGIGVPYEWGEKVAYCFEGRCRAADSGTRCASRDQCLKVEGACGMYAVVHRDFEAQAREHFNRLASVSTCPGDRRAPALRVECREGVCVGDFVD